MFKARAIPYIEQTDSDFKRFILTDIFENPEFQVRGLAKGVLDERGQDN